MIKNLLSSFCLFVLGSSMVSAMSLTGTDGLNIFLGDNQVLTDTSSNFTNQGTQSITESLSGTSGFFSFEDKPGDFLKETQDQLIPSFDPSSASQNLNPARRTLR
ncbi:MAG: hypothetical protein AAGF94_02305 [Pseudomonadota bacterium]